jgi:hypothetical protein
MRVFLQVGCCIPAAGEGTRSTGGYQIRMNKPNRQKNQQVTLAFGGWRRYSLCELLLVSPQPNLDFPTLIILIVFLPECNPNVLVVSAFLIHRDPVSRRLINALLVGELIQSSL